MSKKHNGFVRVLCIVSFILLWPVILLEKILKKIIYFVKKRKFFQESYGVQEFLENSSIERIDIMQGYEFERFLKLLFVYNGFQVAETPRTGDYGADLILTKNATKYVVQAKRYNKNVGSHAIQEIYSAKSHYGADMMIVVTNSHFTIQAEAVARELDVSLVDREELINMIEEAVKVITSTSYVDSECYTKQNFSSFDDNYKFRI